MNGDFPSSLWWYGRQVRTFFSVFSFLAVLATAWPADAGSREAVKKALAATVAVEWRAEQKADQPSPPTNSGQIREEQWVEIDPATGQETVRNRIVGAQSQPIPDLALSSGVVVSADGLVVTLSREHGEGRYTVVFEDGRRLSGKVLVEDRRTGLRLLKIDGQALPHLSLVEAQAEVGDQVFAAFCTHDRGRAAAQGMIAARQGAPAGGFLQLDLAVGQMSAGGPLVDSEALLVGVIAGKIARSPGEDSANFAVPVDGVRALLQARQLENTVVIHRGWLGIKIDRKTEDGPRVFVHPLPDSPAGAGGILDGDELLAIDGEKITSGAEAMSAVARHAAGEKIAVTVLRDEQEQKLEVTLGRAPAARDLRVGLPQPTKLIAPVAPGANLVRPEKLYLLSEDGKTVAVPATPQELERLRTAARALRIPPAPGLPRAVEPQPVPNVIRVERSDMEKKLEELGRNVESLQQQMEKLSDEIKALRSKLAD
ncbi:MAG TPA: trypsin-like peptidase domain-containing protein [Pirellulales bacterium]|nr:trypsin-like peptidase domain-containing protein [Pirellulales bacterium]